MAATTVFGVPIFSNRLELPSDTYLPRNIQDRILPVSPFSRPMLFQSREDWSIEDSVLPIEAVTFREWLKVVFASSPTFIECARATLKQFTQPTGYTVIYSSLHIDTLVATLRGGEQYEPEQLFTFSELADSKILQRPDLLGSLPTHRDTMLFVFDLDLRSGQSCAILVPVRITDFLDVLLRDKFTGFQPLKTPVFAREANLIKCQFCNAFMYTGTPQRCENCHCILCCSPCCFALFTEHSSHQKFCRQLRFLMTGYHNSSC
jgi:hypothetical protein